MLVLLLSLIAPVTLAADPVTRFESPRYGLSTELPSAWKFATREQDELIFVAWVPREDPDQPGVLACEIAIAPESLDEYRTRIDANAKAGRMPGKLLRNEIEKNGEGQQLVTISAFERAGGERWQEWKIRRIANRQLYTFTLNVDDPTFERVKPAFDAVLASTTFPPPETGAELVDAATNRWTQRAQRFSIDLPQGWAPARAPSNLVFLYACGPPQGIWADNLLVIESQQGELDLNALRETIPDLLRGEEPGCEVVSCQVVDQGPRKALETIVRTKRGPFEMTVLERRFAGTRRNYEVKFTLESKRFDELAGPFRQALESFVELPDSP